MFRTFIALDIEKNNQTRLASLKDKLNWGQASIKWVQPANIHLTLKFLGDISKDQISAIKGLLPQLMNDVNPVNTDILTLGAFPKLSHPKVIWAGFSGQEDEIRYIFERLENGLYNLGFPKEEKPFTSHITLGRVKFVHPVDNIEQTLKSFQFDPPLRQSLNSMTFYESTLTAQGPIYSPIINIKLKIK